MKKKNLIRNIVIAAVAFVLVICVIVFSLLLRKDARGLNYFDRSRVVATAGGQSITMGEYVLGLDNTMNYMTYYGYTYSDEEKATLKKNVVDDLLMQKLYLVKLKELGLSLTAEELASCKKTADDQLASLEESIGKQLATGGNFSTANLQSQINSYFNRQLGISKAQYKRNIELQEQAQLARTKVEAYYSEQTKNYTEEELLEFYREEVEEHYAKDYSAGTYAMTMSLYEMGYYQTPYLYVPEGFVYVDLVRIDAETEEGIQEIFTSMENGTTFDDLLTDPRNTATDQLAKLKAPYAIGESDYSYLASESSVYQTAAELEIGGIGLAVVANKTTGEDGTETVSGYTGYIVRRAEGNMCENGAQYGIVDIDYYDGVRDAMKEDFESHRFTDITAEWLKDKTVDESIYEYESK